MRRINKIIFALSCCIMVGLYGCYEDKGNYDYQDLVRPELKGLQEKYTVYALVDTLRIPMEVTPSDQEYDYLWYVFIQGSSKKYDTIAYTKDLEYRVELAPGNYGLVYEARERKTEMTTLQTCNNLSIQTPLTSGWYVLRTTDGQTDIDVFSERGKVESVIASNNNGKQLKGNARSVDFFMRYYVKNKETSRYERKPVMFALTDTDAGVLLTSNGSLVYSFNELFFEIPECRPQTCFGDMSNIYLQNNGQLYGMDIMSQNSCKFALPKHGDYRLSDYSIYRDGKAPLLFDEISSSFYSTESSLDAMIAFPETSRPGLIYTVPSSNNMNAELLYMDVDMQNNVYALIKQQDEHLVLCMNLADVKSRKYNPIRQCDTLDAGSALLKADFRTLNQSNPIIYFSKDNMIYSCHIDEAYKVKDQKVVPNGEKITYMKQMKFEYPNVLDVRFDYLCVATYKAGRYKLYFYHLQAGNLVDNPEFVEGEGQVGAIQYILNEIQTPN